MMIAAADANEISLPEKNKTRMGVMGLITAMYFLLCAVLTIAYTYGFSLLDDPLVLLHPFAMLCLPLVATLLLKKVAQALTFTLINVVGSSILFFAQAVVMAENPAALWVCPAYALLLGGFGLSVNVAGHLLRRSKGGGIWAAEAKRAGAMLGVVAVFFLVMKAYHKLSAYYLASDFLGNDFGVQIYTFYVFYPAFTIGLAACAGRAIQKFFFLLAILLANSVGHYFYWHGFGFDGSGNDMLRDFGLQLLSLPSLLGIAVAAVIFGLAKTQSKERGMKNE